MAPTFASKPTIRQDEDGSTLVFHCAIMAEPKPTITWFHNGVKVHDSDKFQASRTTNSSHSLTIQQWSSLVGGNEGSYRPKG